MLDHGKKRLAPSLRDRRDEVLALAREFIEQASRARGHPPPELSKRSVAALARHPFPGNVRELRNLIGA